MMRARLGIDKNNSWADWAEEEEEAAEPTKTLADAKYDATLPPCTDMMMTIEMILNETKKETMETMGDASECVPATLMRQSDRHCARHTRYHALIASPRASPARSWQQMMRARLDPKVTAVAGRLERRSKVEIVSRKSPAIS